MSPLVEVAVELVEVEGEQGGVGVKELVVYEMGCGKKGKAQLESFRDVFIDAHDHPLVVVFDEFQQQKGDFLGRYKLFDFAFALALSPVELYEYFHVPLIRDDNAIGMYVPQFLLFVLGDVELQRDDEEEQVPEFTLLEVLLALEAVVDLLPQRIYAILILNLSRLHCTSTSPQEEHTHSVSHTHSRGSHRYSLQRYNRQSKACHYSKRCREMLRRWTERGRRGAEWSVRASRAQFLARTGRLLPLWLTDWLLVRPIVIKLQMISYPLRQMPHHHVSALEQLVLWLHPLHQLLLALLPVFFLLVLLALHHLAVLALEPLLARNLHLQLLLDLLLIAPVTQVVVLLPGQEVFRSDWGEGGELGPLEDLDLLVDDLLLLVEGLALNQVLVDPVPRLLDDVEDDRFLVTVDDDLIDFLGDGVDVVAGDAGDGLDLVLERREGVLLGVLEQDTDLVLELVATVRLAQHRELEWRRLLQHRELVQVDVRQRSELVTLVSQVLDVCHHDILSPSHFINFTLNGIIRTVKSSFQ